MRDLKRDKVNYHYVEVMACPSGCLNGGGQTNKQTVALARINDDVSNAAVNTKGKNNSNNPVDGGQLKKSKNDSKHERVSEMQNIFASIRNTKEYCECSGYSDTLTQDNE